MEAIKVISMLVALGAIGWMGMAVLIGGNPISARDYDVQSGVTRAGGVFVVAVAANIVAGRLDRNRK